MDAWPSIPHISKEVRIRCMVKPKGKGLLISIMSNIEDRKINYCFMTIVSLSHDIGYLVYSILRWFEVNSDGRPFLTSS
jgi:hypothetical protein